MRADRIAESECGPDGWMREWPTEPNTMWWFYGHPFGLRSLVADKPNTPELHVVEVVTINSGHVTYIRSGQFMFKGDKVVGLFKKITMQRPPQEMLDELVTA